MKFFKNSKNKIDVPTVREQYSCVAKVTQTDRDM